MLTLILVKVLILVGNACDRNNLFKASKKALKREPKLQGADGVDEALFEKITTSMKENQSSIAKAKRDLLAKGIICVIRSLRKVVCFQVIQHGFTRIGMYPLSTKQCLSNCSKSTLQSLNKGELDFIEAKMPEMVEIFLDKEKGGQITEKEFNDLGIAGVISDNGDRRTTDKDKRTQSHQCAVLLNSAAARARRRKWIDDKAAKVAIKQQKQQQSVTIIEEATETIATRRRKPNRPKDVIENEKLAKKQRNEAKEGR